MNAIAETTKYLAEYDEALPADKYPLVRGWLDSQPLPFLRELREQRPILVTPECTIVALFDDVTELLNLPSIFTVALYLPKMGNGLYLMAHDDDALHTREKSLMMGLLNRDDLPRVRAMVAQAARDLLGSANGRIEAVDGFCRLVPATIVRDYFGLLGIPLADLMEWSYWAQNDTFYNQPFDLLPAEKSKEIADRHDKTGEALGKAMALLIVGTELEVKAEFAAHTLLAPWYLLRLAIRRLLRRQSAATGDTIVKRMVRTTYPKAVDFDITRIGVNAGGLLIGSIETTSQAVAQVIQFLLERPDLLVKAQDAARAESPAAFDGMVWEALRFVPISPYLFRQMASEYTLGEGTKHATTIAAGTYVLAATQSAMFDERAFPDPDEFVPGRNWYHYFHFGFGSHECLGKYVGMVMIPEMVRQIVLLPGLKAEGAIEYEGGHLPQSYRLSWDAA